jgi:K+-sensing histidine kinase KdpD
LIIGGISTPLAWLGVPIILHNKLIGVMCVFQTTQGITYHSTQAEIFQALADEAAVALHNARRYAHAERQTRHLAALNQISRSITSTLDPSRVPLLIMQQVQELIEIEEGSLLLLDEQSGDLVFTYASGPAGSKLIGQRLPAGVGIAGYVATSGRAAIVNDTRADGRFYAATDDDTGYVTRSLLAVPLRGIGGIEGVIEVMNKLNDAPFTEEDRALLEAVADQAVIALENARRFSQVDQALARRARELDRSNNQLREILRLSNVLRAERRLDNLLHQIADVMSHSTGFRSVVIALVRRERTPQPFLQRVVATGPAASAIERMRQSRAPLSRLQDLLRPEFRRGPATYLIDHRYSDYIDLWGGQDQLYIPDMPPAPLGGWHPLNALFSLMRDNRGELLGLLCVDEPEDGLLPTPEQVQILEIFANQAAIAIENAQLYVEQQHNVQSMMALNGLGMALNAAQSSTDQILKLTVSGMVEMTEAKSGVVMVVPDEDPAQLGPVADNTLTTKLNIAFRIGLPPTTENSVLITALLDLAHRAISSGRLVNDRHLAEGKSSDEAEFWVAIPLRATQRALGAICVSYTDGLPSAANLEMLTLFASQAAIALENKRLFSAVHQGHEQLASIMASTNEGMVLIAADGRIVVANNAFKHLVGQGNNGATDSEFVLAKPAGHKLEHLLEHWEAVAGFNETEWRNLRQGLRAIAKGREEQAQGQLNQITPTVHTLEWTVLRVTGAENADPALPLAELPASIANDPHNTTTEALSLLLVLRDITAAKETERLRQDLTSMIVHDLRSPLTSIMTSIDMIFRGVSGEIAPLQRDVLTIAKSSAQHLLNMVNMLLDISRLEGGRMPLDRMPLSVEQIVERAIARFKPIAQDKAIKIKLNLPSNLALVYADGELILRVLQNLIDNALKFSPKGNQVIISAANPPPQPASESEAIVLSDGYQRPCLVYTHAPITLSVRDFGVGILPRYREKIFTKFGQAGEQRHKDGTGLGLTFCKLVVETHGGKLWVESEPGEGSTFRFTLPTVVITERKA